MRTVEEIKKRIDGIDCHISSHKKQYEFYFNDDFDIGQLQYHAHRIKCLQEEERVLKWVLNESV